MQGFKLLNEERCVLMENLTMLHKSVRRCYSLTHGTISQDGSLQLDSNLQFNKTRRKEHMIQTSVNNGPYNEALSRALKYINSKFKTTFSTLALLSKA